MSVVNIDLSNKSPKNKLIEIIKKKRPIKSILKYLSLSDINNFILLNKEIYSIITGKEYNILNEYLLKEYKGSFLLIKKRKIEMKQSNQIIKSIKYGDKLYKNYYKIIQILVLIYYLSSITLLFDIFPLELIFQSKISSNELVIHTPLIIIWVLSLLVLLINKFMTYYIKKRIGKYIDKSIEDISNEQKEKLIINIRRRMFHLKAQGFKTISFLYLFLYTPILGKILFNFKYRMLSRTIAILIALYAFFSHFIKFLCFRIKNRISKIKLYENIFNKKNASKDIDYYNIKSNKIKNKLVYPKFGEVIMGILFYIVKFVFYLVVYLYIDRVLEKVENNDFDIGWNVILIPLDIIGVLFAIYWIIFIYSYKSIQIKQKWKLYLSIGIISFGILINIILIPNFKNKVYISPYILIGVNICLTISAIYYYICEYNLDQTSDEDLS